jgi:hypothetical protein
MNDDKIAIDNKGVIVLRFPVGLTPTTRDFELAFEDQETRIHKTPNVLRELNICDSKGLSWLADLTRKSVLWLHIRLGPIRHRKASEVDPAQIFGGKVQIGKYTILGSFSHETGEIVRKVEIPGLGIRLVPDGKKVRAISVAFLGNEE